MDRFRKILVSLPVLLFLFNALQAQVTTVTEDSLTDKVKGEEEIQTQPEENDKKKGNILDENKNKSTGQEDKETGVKRIRDARPDMSRSRGARPPQVTRPSGSGIPKGMGRPGGARGPGRR